jgi:hypothetical protein
MTNENDGIPPVGGTPDPSLPDASRPDPYGRSDGHPEPPLPGDYGQQYSQVPLRRTPIFSLLSLIAGIISTLGLWVAFIPFLGFFFGVWFPAAAVILGFLGRRRETPSKGLWLTGLILGFVGLGVALLALILWIVIGATGGFTIDTGSKNYNDYVG